MSSKNSTSSPNNPVEDTSSAYNGGAPQAASAPAWDFPKTPPNRESENPSEPVSEMTTLTNAAADDTEIIYDGNLTDRQHRQRSETGGWDRSGGW